MANVVVVGYNGEHGAEAALDESLRLCGDLEAELVVVFGYGVNLPERESADYREALEEVGRKATASALSRAEDAGVKATAEVVFEKAAPALVDAAAKHDARIIVVGSHGERPLAGALLGSVPHRLLHVSERPVLVVRGQ
jgi:nucleotide-binding universal stress UspA family protein